ncbi:MAG TPA: Tol-Pal system beta propeller repeat protein TolB [Gammaproteobacteria bacterium]|nr:Tol-Pal system beta propeller repeat protein TolB [Gammaproteobacteria bacterium]
MIKIVRALLVGTLMSLWAVAAQAALTIEINQGVEGAVPIAVVPFGSSSPQALPQDVSAIIAADLQRSGRFAPLPANDLLSRPTEAAQVNFRDWRVLGVDSLVIGNIEPTGPDSYNIRFQVFDVLRGGQLIGYTVPATRAQLRRVAHQIADQIYEALTGERGAFNTKIAYVTTRGSGKVKQYELQIADSDGYGPSTVVRTKQPLMSPTWAPDASRIAYVSFEKRRAEIYMQDLRTGSRSKLASFSGINGAPSWSPDGTRLALTLSRDGNPEIYIMRVADGSLTRLTQSPSIDTEPTWSPDGQSIVFTSDRGGGPQLYQVSAGGGQAQRLTFEGNYNASPDYSADGKRLSMVHRDGNGNYRIAVYELDTRMLRVVSEGRLDESPSLAPNGRMVIYAASDARGVLATSSVDGRAGQRLTFQEGAVREPAWSPFLPK